MIELTKNNIKVVYCEKELTTGQLNMSSELYSVPDSNVLVSWDIQVYDFCICDLKTCKICLEFACFTSTHRDAFSSPWPPHPADLGTAEKAALGVPEPAEEGG